MTPALELAALGRFYGVAVDDFITVHGPALTRYAEWVLARDAFAVVTLGDAASIARFGSPTAAARLRDAVARWPDAITGIKLDPTGREEPTLYVRPLCPWDEGVAWLEREVGGVATRIPPSRTLYGLGFQGDLVKTYALAPDGFVSYRIAGDELYREHKDYRADVAWDTIDWPDDRWTAIGALGRVLGFRNAGHVGETSGGERKLYVERVGGIPTDRSVA
ncbi:MAG: hypothetical protein M4D80_15510 [Myxococcota bacterium]|nr:hypothetical protein [Myxococcota bacterium]